MTEQTLYLEIVTPEALVFTGAVSQVDLPGSEGYFGVLPNHAPLIANLASGTVTIYKASVPAERFSITGGVAEVTGDRCTVLATSVTDLPSA